MPILLSRGCAMISYQSWKALGGRDGAKALFPDTDFEIVYSADDVREVGTKMLDALNTPPDAG